MRDIYKDEKECVLLNKLGINNESALEQAEYDIVSAKASFVDIMCTGMFDINHFKNINKFLFGDVYEWAGEFRTVPIWKEERVFGYTDSVRYSKPDCIEKDLQDIFKYYNSLKWDTMNYEAKQDILIDFLTDIWKVHPFREGNTRSSVTFICMYAESVGVNMDKTVFAENPTFMRDALVFASDGKDYADKSYLSKITKDSIRRGLEHKNKLKKDTLINEHKTMTNTPKVKNARDTIREEGKDDSR